MQLGFFNPRHIATKLACLQQDNRAQANACGGLRKAPETRVQTMSKRLRKLERMPETDLK